MSIVPAKYNGIERLAISRVSDGATLQGENLTWYGNNGYYTDVISDDVADITPNLNAIASDIDLESGTATLSGVASSDTTDVDISWTTAKGTEKKRNVDVVGGKFTQQLTELAIGTTTVHLTAWNGGEVIAETDVEVKLEVAPVTANAEFSSEVMKTVQLSGTAQPNAPIEFRTAEKVVGGSTADGAGNWTGTVNAPNEPGLYNIDVVQKVRDADAGRAALDIDYGPGVSVTSPADGFEIDPEEPELSIRGNAPAGTKVEVYEKGHAATQLGEPATAGSSGTYRLKTVPLEDREYTLVVEGITKGYNRTRAELTVNPGKSTVENPTATVQFADDVTKEATVTGAGVDGATITVKDETGKTLGTTTVKDGKWSTQIRSLGAGKHTLTVEQTGIEGSQTVTTEADFGAAVTATGPEAAIAGSTATVTGTGADGSRIEVTENGVPVASGTVENGVFSIPVEKVQDGEHTYTVTQTARGNTVTTAEVVLTRDAVVTPVTLTSPQSGDTYPAKSTVRFTGTGTPGATVLLDAFGGLADYSTTVAWDGTWTIDRPMNIGTYRFDVVQTAKGQESRVDGIELVEDGTPVDGPFEVTAPTSGSTHKNEVVAFTGTGTPGSTITIDPKVPGLSTVTTTVPLNGKWSVNRYVGSGAYDFDVYQTTKGAENGRTSIQINQPSSVVRPFAVTSPEDGSEHKNESVAVTGTGTPGSDILVHVSNFSSADVTAKVGTDGTWKATKWLGGGSYVLEVSQTTNGAPNGSTTLHVNKPAAPVDQPFAITSHADGDRFTPNRSETFRGTGAAGATITLDPGNGLAKVTTQVTNTGDWSVTKWLGNGPYTFTVSQTKDGETTSLPPFTITPAE
ncbi:hypothetical protein [Curtobacterium sp. NPDC092190]|uniref:hypothetical protein n=1 Tax=Curtobacterium sp. NPDC092190 TaxID=3363973 RepID=UPI0037F8A1BF